MAPLRRLIDQSLTAVDVVAAPLWTVDPGMSVADARDLLAGQRYDLAGIAEESISRYVTLEWLSAATGGMVADYSVPIPASRCIEKGLPLGRLVDSLRDEESVFVLDGDVVRWLVTRADLQAPAFGVAILSHLVVIEQGLRLLVRHEVGDEWLNHLTPSRSGAINQRFEDLRQKNQEISIDLCANFSDWLYVARKSVVIRSRLGFETAGLWRKATAHFPDARNDVAHGRTLFDGVEFQEGVRRIRLIREFAENVWSQVDTLDIDFDVYSDAVIEAADGSQLAGPEADAAMFVDAPVFVVTAANPGSVQWSDALNRSANDRLKDLLTRGGSEWSDVVGMASDGSGREESVLVTNANRAYVTEVAARFNQRAIFELEAEELRVIRCSDGVCVRTVPRRRPRAEYRTLSEWVGDSDF